VFNFSQFFHRAGHWFPPCLMTTVQLYQAGLAVVAPWNLYHIRIRNPMKLAELIPHPDDLIALPPGELGRRMLPVLLAWPHDGKQLQLVQFLPARAAVAPSQDHLGYALDRRTPQIEIAVREAWAWLEGQGLLIPDTQFDHGVSMLSTRGHKLAKAGLSKIFINYRRSDEPGFVRALFSLLAEAFSAEQLFIDVDDIPPGEDFVLKLESQVAQCDVMLVVIGKSWLDATGEHGNRRLDDPNDFVRIEIEAALKQGKRVIPVLVHGARMPRPDELPESLRQLATRNAVPLTHDRFADDGQALVKTLRWDTP
jgi:TIR domain